MKVKLETIRRSTGWWVTGLPDYDDCGPYDTRKEAEEDRIGMERFYRICAKEGIA